MNNILKFIDAYQNELILGLSSAVILLLILLFITMINLSIFRNKYNALNKGNHGVTYDDILIQCQRDISRMDEAQRMNLMKLESIEKDLLNTFSNMSMYRYNAFEGQGGKMSFILLLLNDHRDGIILHNIHNNEHSYIYSKNVKRGITEETLTPEERNLLAETISKMKK